MDDLFAPMDPPPRQQCSGVPAAPPLPTVPAAFLRRHASDTHVPSPELRVPSGDPAGDFAVPAHDDLVTVGLTHLEATSTGATAAEAAHSSSSSSPSRLDFDECEGPEIKDPFDHAAAEIVTLRGGSEFDEDAAVASNTAEESDTFSQTESAVPDARNRVPSAQQQVEKPGPNHDAEIITQNAVAEDEDALAAPDNRQGTADRQELPRTSKTTGRASAHTVIPLAQWLRPHAGPDGLLTGDTVAKYNVSLVETLREFDVDVTGIAPLPCGETPELPRLPGALDPAPQNPLDVQKAPPFLPITIPAFVEDVRSIYTRVQGKSDAALWPRFLHLCSWSPEIRSYATVRGLILAAIECGLLTVMLPARDISAVHDESKTSHATLQHIVESARVAWTPEFCDFDRVRPLRSPSKPLQQRPAFTGSFVAVGDDGTAASLPDTIRLSADVILIAMTNLPDALKALLTVPTHTETVRCSTSTKRSRSPSPDECSNAHTQASDNGEFDGSSSSDDERSADGEGSDDGTSGSSVTKPSSSSCRRTFIDYATVVPASPTLRSSAGRGSVLLFAWLRSLELARTTDHRVSVSHFAVSQLQRGKMEEPWELDVALHRDLRVSRFDVLPNTLPDTRASASDSHVSRDGTSTPAQRRWAVLGGGTAPAGAAAVGTGYPVRTVGATCRSRRGANRVGTPRGLSLSVLPLSASPHFHHPMHRSPQQLEQAFPHIPMAVIRHPALVAFRPLYHAGGLLCHFEKCHKNVENGPEKTAPNTWAKALVQHCQYSQTDASEAVAAAVCCGVLRLAVKGGVVFVKPLASFGSPIETALIKNQGRVAAHLMDEAAGSIAACFPLAASVPQELPRSRDCDAPLADSTHSLSSGLSGEYNLLCKRAVAIVLSGLEARAVVNTHIHVPPETAPPLSLPRGISDTVRLSVRLTGKFPRLRDALKLAQKMCGVKKLGVTRRLAECKAACTAPHDIRILAKNDLLICVPTNWRDLIDDTQSHERVAEHLCFWTRMQAISALELYGELDKLKQLGDVECAAKALLTGEHEQSTVQSNSAHGIAPALATPTLTTEPSEQQRSSVEEEASGLLQPEKIASDASVANPPKTAHVRLDTYTFQFGGVHVTPFPPQSLVLQGLELHGARRKIMKALAGMSHFAPGSQLNIKRITAGVVALAQAGLQHKQRFMCLVDLIQLVSQRLPMPQSDDRLMIGQVTKELTKRADVDVRQWPGASLLTFVVLKPGIATGEKNPGLTKLAQVYAEYVRTLRPAGLEVKALIKNTRLPLSVWQQAEDLRATWAERNRDPNGPPRSFSAHPSPSPLPKPAVAKVEQPPKKKPKQETNQKKQTQQQPPKTQQQKPQAPCRKAASENADAAGLLPAPVAALGEHCAASAAANGAPHVEAIGRNICAHGFPIPMPSARFGVGVPHFSGPVPAMIDVVHPQQQLRHQLQVPAFEHPQDGQLQHHPLQSQSQDSHEVSAARQGNATAGVESSVSGVPTASAVLKPRVVGHGAPQQHPPKAPATGQVPAQSAGGGQQWQAFRLPPHDRL